MKRQIFHGKGLSQQWWRGTSLAILVKWWQKRQTLRRGDFRRNAC
ncbi:hypothetical protein V6Z11_A12G126800 [Gossypium hirsutum]